MREKRSVGEWLSVVVCFFQKKSKKKLPEQLLLCRIQWSLEVKQSTVCTIVLHFFFFKFDSSVCFMETIKKINYTLYREKLSFTK